VHLAALDKAHLRAEPTRDDEAAGPVDGRLHATTIPF
jgi:hypothetical protein